MIAEFLAVVFAALSLGLGTVAVEAMLTARRRQDALDRSWDRERWWQRETMRARRELRDVQRELEEAKRPRCDNPGHRHYDRKAPGDES